MQKMNYVAQSWGMNIISAVCIPESTRMQRPGCPWKSRATKLQLARWVWRAISGEGDVAPREPEWGTPNQSGPANFDAKQCVGLGKASMATMSGTVRVTEVSLKRHERVLWV